MIVEAGNAEGEIRLDRKMTDLLTGMEYEGNMKIAPYGVYVLKK